MQWRLTKRAEARRMKERTVPLSWCFSLLMVAD